ncbi:MAG: DivIVA domain-containing protein [Tessaracoccus sp.]|uniref:DivIVA domain-containing protein n=1 Tax=Tessaracoccus sp. TaxID=1971211 RepID=UPI001ECEE025|nr:DivIVA domain-containing protein [Tessaracoccus sp.]MBK7821274.1 DivIVA domain-containing protein [Tessaracoccus sp.]
MSDTPRDLDTEETGLNLFDERASAAGSFPHAMLGYDKTTVDSYVREVESRASQLRADLREARHQTEMIRVQLGTTDFTRLGAHTTALLRSAEAQAADIVSRATREGERIKIEARRTSAELRDAAQQEADDIRLTGLSGLRQLRQEQAEAGKEALAAARRDADLFLSEARQRAKASDDAAAARALALAESSAIDAARVGQEAARRAAQVEAEAAAVAEETLARVAAQARDAEEKITQRLADAEAAADAAAARAAAAQDEAEKARTDAVAEAEGIRLAANRESEEKLAVARRRAVEVIEELEEKLAWRKEELEREIADLEAKRLQSLAALGNLRALAEESEARFAADEPTTVIPQVKPRP